MPPSLPHSFKVQGPPSPPTTPAAADAPIYEITVANSRLLDQLATSRYAIPTILLMENAAIALAHHALAMLAAANPNPNPGSPPSALIAAGPGNNAGDGFALARHLQNNHIPTRVITTHPQSHYTGDARTNLDIITAMGIPIAAVEDFLANPPSTPPALIADALFGTGLTRPIRGPAADLITWINRTRATNPTSPTSRVLAADIPSGLDASTGQPLGDAVITADRTITFAAIKQGMSAVEAQPYLGETHIAPISIPPELLKELATKITPPTDPTRT